MLQTIKEIGEANDSDPGVMNGVDNPNLMSVDSTDPVATEVEVLDENDKVIEGAEKDESVKKLSEDTEPEKDPEPESEPEKKPKEETDDLSKNVQKRIGTLTKKWRTAEREANYKDTVIADLEKKLEELQAGVEPDGKPDRADFEDDNEYVEALTDWKVDTKLAASKNKEILASTTKEQKQEILEVYEGMDVAIENGKAKYDDFEEVTQDETVVLSVDVMQLALDTEVPEDMLYYLCSNPDESERISSLSAVKSAKEIVKLEAQLKKVNEPKTEPVKKTQSNAPAPIKPVSANGLSEKDPDKMTPAEYRKWRQSQ
jgi:hypothetical protein